MLFKNLFDLTLGRLRIPPRTAAPPGNSEGELWLNQVLARITYWSRIGSTPTLQRILTDLDLNQPGGPVALNDAGVIPAAYLPTASEDVPVIPVGTILPWMGDPITPPGGWLFADGSEIPIVAQYQNLYNILRNKCGPATAGYFRLPSAFGRMPVGALSGSSATSGQIHKVVIRNPGQGYTDGNYPAVFSGGTVTTPPTGSIDVIGGKVVRVNITTPGVYTAIGAAPANLESNCAILLAGSGWGPGVGFAYDIFMAPTDNSVQEWGIRLTNRGAGYSSTPAVTVSPSSSGVTAVAVMDGDTVREVLVTCRGVSGLDPTTLTIGFSGGGTPTTAAVAEAVRWSSPVIVGDHVGEQQHQQVIPELAKHKHVGRRDSLVGGGGSTPTAIRDGTATESYAGDDLPTPNVPPGFGAIYIIKY